MKLTAVAKAGQYEAGLDMIRIYLAWSGSKVFMALPTSLLRWKLTKRGRK